MQIGVVVAAVVAASAALVSALDDRVPTVRHAAVRKVVSLGYTPSLCLTSLCLCLCVGLRLSGKKIDR